MALVRNETDHAITLDPGPSIAPGETANVDLSLEHNADLYDAGDIRVTDPDMEPPAPEGKRANVRAILAVEDADTEFVIDVSEADPDVPVPLGTDGLPWDPATLASDTELAAAIAAVGGRFRGDWVAVTAYRVNDFVRRPSDQVLIYTATARTSRASFDGTEAATWTTLTAESSGGGGISGVVGAAAPVIPGDDGYVDEVISELENFLDWLTDNDQKGFIGEFGWPSNVAADSVAWNALAEAYFARLDAHGDMWTAAYVVSELIPDYRLQIYAPTEADEILPISEVERSARVVEAHPSTSDILRGVFLLGGDGGIEQIGGTSASSNAREVSGWAFRQAGDGTPFQPAEPAGGVLGGFGAYGGGKYAKGWTYGCLETYQFLARRGIKLIRLPFRWERLQRSWSGTLDATELARLDQAVTWIGECEMKVMLDMHNFGQYFEDDGTHGVAKAIGGVTATDARFADFWGKMAAHYADNETVVALDLCNEPAFATDWEEDDGPAQAAVTAIRTAGFERTIVVSGGSYSSVKNWSNPPWITDPGPGDLRYQAHHYWNLIEGGNSVYGYTYAEELAVYAPGDAPTDGVFAHYKGTSLGANGTAITSWPDVSGNARHATQSNSDRRPIVETASSNGISAARFDGSNDFLNLPNMEGFTAGTVFVVVKLDADPPPFASKAGLLKAGGSNEPSVYPFTDGIIYEALGSTTRKTVGNPADALTDYHIYEVKSAPGEYEVRLDGEVLFTTATNTVSFPGGPWLGAEQLTGGQMYALDGVVAELLIVAGDTSDEDRDTHRADIAERHAISLPLDSPISGVSPWGWWEASTLGAASSGVASWADSSGNGRHLTQATSGFQPLVRAAASNGLKAIEFDGFDDRLAIPDMSALTGATVFVVIKLDSDPPDSGFKGGLFHSSSAVLTGLYPYSADSTIYESFGTTVRKTVGNPTPSLANWHVYEIKTAAGSYVVKLDGVDLFTTATNTVNFVSAPLLGRSTGAQDYALDGRVAEMVILGSAASDADRTTVRNDLMDRHAITP